jgi:hypothetical protein
MECRFVERHLECEDVHMLDKEAVILRERPPTFAGAGYGRRSGLPRPGSVEGKDRWKARRSLEDESMDVAAPLKTRAAADGGQRWS